MIAQSESTLKELLARRNTLKEILGEEISDGSVVQQKIL